MTIQEKMTIKVLYLATWTAEEIVEYTNKTIEEVSYMIAIVKGASK